MRYDFSPCRVLLSENGETDRLASHNLRLEASTTNRQESTMSPAATTTEEIHVAIAPSSLGFVLIARSSAGLAAILLGDDRDALLHDLETRFPLATLEEGGDEMSDLVTTIIGVIETPERQLNEPLDLRGTTFQRAVWNALREIPAGTTASYAEIARRIGRPNSVRAVAQACAGNPLAVVVPCHRVVRSDGDLSGYRWGIERKRALLEREASSAR
jgi:AraC family transcriptional regulator, regulatory protein of adaptative response / methylated-DNA-[protein]-cysteine methyltransferase